MQTSKDKNEEGTYYRLSDTVTQYNTEAKSLFLIKKKTFGQQFSNLYFLRLKQMKPKLLQRAQKKYPDATVVDRVLELKYDEDDPEKKYIVVGTLFKDMKLKPNILQEYTREVCFHVHPWECYCFFFHPVIDHICTHTHTQQT
jgi:DNA polymerase delta subunit 2